jgi:hypothetical protein
MSTSITILKSALKRKLATAVLVSASLAAFATLGDGRYTSSNNAPSITKAHSFSSKNFSLRTGYNYRSNNILNFNSEKKFIMLNTVATYQKGNATYVLPMKKRVILDKVKFNPAN